MIFHRQNVQNIYWFPRQQLSQVVHQNIQRENYSYSSDFCIKINCLYTPVIKGEYSFIRFQRIELAEIIETREISRQYTFPYAKKGKRVKKLAKVRWQVSLRFLCRGTKMWNKDAEQHCFPRVMKNYRKSKRVKKRGGRSKLAASARKRTHNTFPRMNFASGICV